MRRPGFASLVLAVSLPNAALADMGTPGFSRVPHDYVIEVESTFPGYRFWLISPRGLEPLDLAPGRPLIVNGEGRLGSHRNARVIAAPVGLIEGIGEEQFQKLDEKRWSAEADPRLSQVHESGPIDFYGSVPFFDSRERVIDRYRLEFVPGQHVRLVWLEQNAGSRWVKRAWLAAGILVPVAVLWGFWWAVRRLRRG